jgi:hypothetical protein
LKAVKKWEVEDKRIRESNGCLERTKVKHTHSGYTLRNAFEY